MNAPFENRVGGRENLTLLDYPNHLSAILFYNGCNLRCPYCYNPSLVNNKIGVMDSEEIVSFLKNRQGKLDGIVFSGGECTVWGSKLLDDIKFVKEIGYKVKIDTNGINCQFVIDAINEGLIDYVALDIKAPRIGTSCFKFVNNPDKLANPWILLQWLITMKKIPFETRTTIHPDVTDEQEASLLLKELAEVGVKKHYFQFFFETGETLGNVNQMPRYFNMSKVDTHGVEVELRNKEGNERRKKFEEAGLTCGGTEQ